MHLRRHARERGHPVIQDWQVNLVHFQRRLLDRPPEAGDDKRGVTVQHFSAIRGSGKRSSQFGFLRASYFQLWRKCAVLVFSGRTDQRYLVAAALYVPALIHVGSRGIRRGLDLCVYLFCALVYGIRTVVGNSQRIGLSRIISFHGGYCGTDENERKSAAPPECYLAFHRATPVVLLLYVVILVEDRRHDPSADDCLFERLLLRSDQARS